MKLSLFDLHCDTACRMLAEGQPLEQNNFAVSLQKASVFERYIQTMALWTDDRLSDEEGWERAQELLKNLRCDPALQSGKAYITTEFSDTKREGAALLLGIEDARILAGNVGRLDLLFQEGVRILTPLWSGETCIGGSHNTNSGLTPFGKEALDRAASLGMLLDISHASERSAEEMFAIAERFSAPVIASHSNAYEICPVSRNLKKHQIESILHSHGLIGINLYTYFLNQSDAAGILDILRHVEYFLSLGARDALCLGCDMDGADMPQEIPDVSYLSRLAEAMYRHNYEESFIRAFFFENAYQFARQYLQ